MVNVGGGEAGADVFHDIGQRGFRLIGHARHGIEGGGMPEALFREGEYHDRGGSAPVHYHLAVLRYVRLAQVDVQHVQATGVKYLIHKLFLTFVAHISAASAQFGERVLGNVVLCGPEPSGRDNYLIP